MKTIAIIPSGGKGLRMGSEIPKQYIKVAGKEILAHTLTLFETSEKIDEIAVSAEENYFGFIEELKKKYGIAKLKYIVKGGATRQDSVFNALKAVEAERDDLIAVHDAARPLLRTELLNKAIDFARLNGATVVAINANDTVIEGGKYVEKFHERKRIFLAQTPQIFRYEELFNAIKNASEKGISGTDESTVVNLSGIRVNIFPGDSNNIKITTKRDLTLCEFLVKFKHKLGN